VLRITGTSWVWSEQQFLPAIIEWLTARLEKRKFTKSEYCSRVLQRPTYGLHADQPCPASSYRDPSVGKSTTTRRIQQHQEGITKSKRRKTSVSPPYSTNPFDFYHQGNGNRRRVATLAAFNYWILPHLKARDGSTENVIRSRVASIPDLLVLCRKPGATTTGLDDTVIRVGEDLPSHDVVTHDLEFTKEEYDFYQARKGVCGKEFDFDFADIAAKEQHLTGNFLAKKPGSMYQQVF
jgi:hypothetical protein